MTKRHFFVFAVLFAVCMVTTTVNADLFSATNRYELSTTFQDSSCAAFYSLPGLNAKNDFNHFLKLQFREEQLGIGAGGIIALESADDKAAAYGVVVGDAQFLSPYLDSRVRVNVYTMKNVTHAEPTDIEFERFNSGRPAPISGMFDIDFTLPEAYLKLKYKSINLTIGREKVRWGPGYKGTLALSGTSTAPFYYYHLRMNLLNHVHLSCFLAGFDDDKYYKNDFTGYDTLKSKTKKTSITSLPPRYGVGQRIDVVINDHLQFGIHELCNFYGANDLTRYANPLQIYYLGFNSGTNEANMLAGCDMNLIFKPLRFYGEFLDDDITIFDNKGNPNKYAFQLGTVCNREKIVKEIGIEYTHVSKYTYGHYSILNRQEYWGEPIAWPWGNDQDLFTMHLLLKPYNNLLVKFETDYWMKGQGTLKDDWYVDGKPDLDHVPFWTQNASKIVSFMIGCEYTPFSWLGVNFSYKPSFEGDNMSNDIFSYIILNIPGNKLVKF